MFLLLGIKFQEIFISFILYKQAKQENSDCLSRIKNTKNLDMKRSIYTMSKIESHT